MKQIPLDPNRHHHQKSLHLWFLATLHALVEGYPFSPRTLLAPRESSLQRYKIPRGGAGDWSCAKSTTLGFGGLVPPQPQSLSLPSPKRVTARSNSFISLPSGVQNGLTHFPPCSWVSTTQLTGRVGHQLKPIPCGGPARNTPLEAHEGRAARLLLPAPHPHPLLALPWQHFTQERSKLVWSWLPEGEMARWKVSPLRGAAPELGP